MRGGKILEEGKSGYSGGRSISYSHMTTHAEIDVLKKLQNQKKRKISKMFLISVAYNGFEFQMSKPCKNCCKTIMDIGIDKIYWCDTEGSWNCDRVHDLYNTSIYSSGDRYTYKERMKCQRCTKK